jgi:hypothetical protein
VVPGVAIATASMPPRCTAGYGLATGSWRGFFGAFYLYTIDGVFIAAAAALVSGAFEVRQKQFVDARVEARVRLAHGIVVAVTMLPSLYLAYRLVGAEVFRSRATQFARTYLQFPGVLLTDINVDPGEKSIDVSLIGRQSQHIDVTTLRSGVLSDLYKETQAALQAKEQALRRVEGERDALKGDLERFKDIPAELRALYPQVGDVLISRGAEWDSAKGILQSDVVVLNVRSKGGLRSADRRRIEQWLTMRSGTVHVRVVVEDH